jgi:hypothetical protein
MFYKNTKLYVGISRGAKKIPQYILWDVKLFMISKALKSLRRLLSAEYIELFVIVLYVQRKVW